MRSLLPIQLAACSCMFAVPAAAQLGPNGSRITDNDYRVDLSQGPVTSGSRVIGLSGAYVAIAEGVDGLSQNPAAAAVRPAHSFDYFDFDWGVGITFPSSLRNSDFFNTGRARTNLLPTDKSQFIFLDLGGLLQFGRFGVGANVSLQQYGLNRTVSSAPDTSDRLVAQTFVAHTSLAYTFLGGELVLGAGSRSTGLELVNEGAQSEDATLFATTGAGLELGAVWLPQELPVRAGLAFQSAISTDIEGEVGADVLYETTDPLYLPHAVTLPWTLIVGSAFQLGSRPLNPKWIDPSDLIAPLARKLDERAVHRKTRRRELESVADTRGRKGDDARRELAALDQQEESDEKLLDRTEAAVNERLRDRYRRMSRSYCLVSMAMLVSGKSEDAVGVEAFLHRTVNRSGQDVTLSPRLGIESEVIPNLLKLRAGSYIEPTRFRSNPNTFRVHATLGTEVNVLGWSVFGLFHRDTRWRVGLVGDVARDFANWGFTLGVWH